MRETHDLSRQRFADFLAARVKARQREADEARGVIAGSAGVPHSGAKLAPVVEVSEPSGQNPPGEYKFSSDTRPGSYH